MAGYFFDTSGIVKRYVAEIGTAWVTGLLHPIARNAINLARITGVEFASAITRRMRGGSLTPTTMALALAQFRHDLTYRFRLVAIVPRLLNRAMILAEMHGLRGYDAVQLAAALRANARRLARGISGLIFVSADAALLAAASAEGLTTEDPNTHP